MDDEAQRRADETDYDATMSRRDRVTIVSDSEVTKVEGRLSDEKKAEREARERVTEIKAFYTHLAVFMVVHAALVGIYLLSGGGHFWPLYSFFGWGIGLASHAATTFDMFGMYGKNWEDQKVREIMLQKEHGLSADEVKSLLREEMRSERRVLPSAAEMRRLQERIENLEAIVTSRDWDELPSHSGVLQQEDDFGGTGRTSVRSGERQKMEADESPARAPDNDLADDLRGASEAEDPAARAERLARRVR